MGFEIKATIATFGGQLLKLSHESTSTKTPMSVYVYLPPQATTTTTTAAAPVPVLIYLSGLTCTPDNAAEKGFLHAAASRHGIAVVYPDTSPRGAGVAGEDDAYDFGSAAGFYVDATRAPWSANYRMYTYVVHELLDLLFTDHEVLSWGNNNNNNNNNHNPKLDRNRISITGHSMGGHGALSIYLKNPGLFRSVSAFAPISNPAKCPWGEKAFSGYLGDEDADKEGAWKSYDSTELVAADAWKGKDLRALVDVGTADGFYKSGQLLPENFEKAASEAGVTGLTVRYQKDYDHSYFFISSFAQDHVDHAAKYLL